MQIKHLIPIAAALLLTTNLMAQEFKMPVDNAKDKKLVLEDFIGDLPIEGYAGNEIIITAAGGDFQTPDRAKGLKPIYPGGSDNTGIGLSQERNGDRITLKCLLPIGREGSYKIKVPENLALSITRGCDKQGLTTILNFRSEVEFKGCSDIRLKNVTGPLVISTISGNVDVVFTDLNKDRPISIASISGEVDVTMPAKTGVNLEMSNISGNMYSDFDLPNDAKDMKRVGGGALHAKLNGGGTDLKLHNVSGNIYLRKS